MNIANTQTPEQPGWDTWQTEEAQAPETPAVDRGRLLRKLGVAVPVVAEKPKRAVRKKKPAGNSATPPPWQPPPLGTRFPGPYSLGKVGYCSDHLICDGAVVIAKVTPCGYPIGVGWHPNSAATAEFLVRAANAHDQMLDACRQALALLGAHRQYLPADRSDETMAEFNRVACMLGDAIAKAATRAGESAEELNKWRAA
jgi:hypothetical protein